MKMNDRVFWTPSNRNMLLFFTGKLASVLGSGMYTFVVGLFILKLTGSGGSFAVTMVCGLLPRILLAPFAGVTADRMNRRKLLICSDLAAVLTLLLTFLTVSLGGVSLLPVYASLVLLSVCSTFYGIAVSSSLLQLVEDEQIQRAGSLNQIAGSIGNLLAPVLGGMLYALVPLKLFMLLNAAGFAVSTLMSCGLRFKPSTVTGVQTELPDSVPGGDARRVQTKVLAELRSSLAGGISYVFKKPVIRAVINIVFWVNFFVVSLNVVMPFVAVKSLSLSSSQYGTINAMMAAGILAMSLLLTVRRQKTSPAGSLILGLSTLGLLFIAMALPMLFTFSTTSAYFFLLILMFLVGVTVMNINIPIQVYLQQTVEEEYRGRVFAVVETASGAIAPAGMILYGMLLDRVPSGFLLLASGVAIVLVALLGRRGLKNGRALEVMQNRDPLPELHA
ncbi:MFS transporter [Paenibacillus riograndensis]|uniref:Putative membrane protein n=3 Tax=Paenibacillus riograndensis TaxID=483937 RepID=A0A0E4HBQ6_9BACL|nr:MFS transporter [Paenibacillus riograndensis]CQR56944.1 putative membrane protein [Paenibacillus riograndensis SBR5]